MHPIKDDCYTNQGNNTIEEFNTNGVGMVFASGLDNPIGIAIQPVPEPSTWALLAMGIGAVLRGFAIELPGVLIRNH